MNAPIYTSAQIAAALTIESAPPPRRLVWMHQYEVGGCLFEVQHRDELRPLVVEALGSAAPLRQLPSGVTGVVSGARYLGARVIARDARLVAMLQPEGQA